jgi:hypothetical protein
MKTNEMEFELHRIKREDTRGHIGRDLHDIVASASQQTAERLTLSVISVEVMTARIIRTERTWEQNKEYKVKHLRRSPEEHLQVSNSIIFNGTRLF